MPRGIRMAPVILAVFGVAACGASQGGGNTGNSAAAVSIVGAVGHGPDDVVSGALQVSVAAWAASGVSKVELSDGSRTLQPAAGSSPPVWLFELGTAGSGDLVLVATLTTSEGATVKSTPYILHVDNTLPALTLSAASPAMARVGSLVTVDVTATEPLSTVAGTATLVGTPDVPLSLLATTGVGASARYTLGFIVPNGAQPGPCTLTVIGVDPAGNRSTASVGAAVRGPFSVTSLAVSVILPGGSTGTEMVGGIALPAGRSGSALRVVATVPAGIPLATPAAVFTLVDGAGASRQLTGTVAVATAGADQTLTIDDAIGAGEASGPSRILVTASDAAGNQAFSATGLVIDNVAPALVGLAPDFDTADPARACANGSCSANASGKVRFSALASEPLGRATYTLSGGGTGAGSCACDGDSCDGSSAAVAPLVTCDVALPLLPGDAPATVVFITVHLEDRVQGSSDDASAFNRSSLTVVASPQITSFGTSATLPVLAGTPAPLIAVFPDGGGNVGEITNSTDFSMLAVTSGTPIPVSPLVNTAYTLTVTNPVGSAIVSAPLAISVQMPGFVGSLAFSEPVITGGRTAALALNLPTFVGAASATLLDGTGATALEAGGMPITSGALLAAAGALVSLEAPPTSPGASAQLSYTLVTLSGGTPPAVSTAGAVLSVVPVPTATLSSNFSAVTSGNAVELTVKTTGAACMAPGSCLIGNGTDATLIPVVGDTNAAAGVTVAATVDQSKTYAASVKNAATVPAAASSGGVTVTAVPSPTATLVGNLATVTVNNTLTLTLKTTNAACTIAGKCEIVDDHDANVLPVVGNTNAPSGVTVGTVVTQAQTFTAKVRNAAQDATPVASAGLPIATRPAPTAVLSTPTAMVARDTQIQLTVKTTDADCTVAGNCMVVDDMDSTVLSVVGNTNAAAGVTVPATVDQSKTYTARVKANVADTVFASSSGLLVTAN